MALNVIWSPSAESQLVKTISYLEAAWDSKTLKTFFQKLESNIDTIANNPKSGKISNRLNNLREITVTKHNSIFYTFDSDSIYIITFWSNSMTI